MTRVWLIAALVISTQFTGSLFDFIVRPLPLTKIKSLEQLSQREGMNICVRGDSWVDGLKEMAETGVSQLAVDIGNKLETYLDYYAEGVDKKLAERLLDGTIAWINDRLIMVYTLIEISRTENVSFDSVYISTESSELIPYFYFVNKAISPWACAALNYMY